MSTIETLRKRSTGNLKKNNQSKIYLQQIG